MMKAKKNIVGADETLKTILEIAENLSDDNSKNCWYVITKKLPVSCLYNEPIKADTFNFEDKQIVTAIKAMAKSGKDYYPLDAIHSLCAIRIDGDSSLRDKLMELYEDQSSAMDKKAKNAEIKGMLRRDPGKFIFVPYVESSEVKKAEACLYGMQFKLWIPSVRTLRTITGLTQTEFGNKYMIPMRSIQNWESKDRESPEYVRYLLMTNVIDDVKRGCFR